MTKQRTAPWPADEDVPTGRKMPIVIDAAGAPLRRLMEISDDFDNPKSGPAIGCLITLALLYLFTYALLWPLTFTISLWLGLAWAVFNLYQLYAMLRWVFAKEDT